MTDRQRVVLVIAWGALLAIAGATLNRLLLDQDSGWFSYAPNAGVVTSFDRTEWIWREALVWLGAVVLWAAPSYWLLRPRRRPPD